MYLDHQKIHFDREKKMLYWFLVNPIQCPSSPKYTLQAIDCSSIISQKWTSNKTMVTISSNDLTEDHFLKLQTMQSDGTTACSSLNKHLLISSNCKGIKN